MTMHRGTRASFWRGGTSNGILLDSKNVPGWSEINTSNNHRDQNDLPIRQAVINDFLAAIMGAPDPYMRQLNGMGQGVSSTSKVMIVERSSEAETEEGVDLDYWFVQVGINTGKSDLSGNCGNLSSAVGPFALNNGLIPNPEKNLDRTTLHMNEKGQQAGTMNVKMRNRNHKKLISLKFEAVQDEYGWSFDDTGDVSIDGVSQTSTPIILTFHEPAGSSTHNLKGGPAALPTSNPIDILTIKLPPDVDTSLFPDTTYEVTLSDICNPAVILDGRIFLKSFDPAVHKPEYLTANKSLIDIIELIRRAGAEKMVLDPEIPGTPAVLLVYPPQSAFSSSVTSDGKSRTRINIVARAVCMSQAHKAVPMTFGMNISACTNIKGTIPNLLVRGETVEDAGNSSRHDLVRIGHPSGVVEFGADVTDDGEVKGTKVTRTARWLMDGWVNSSG